ncbi:DUF3343 domain-containing protein [Clostridium tarantellae]|uniref:DUF3343 domain-containing protein n=1 Tax=Clostridium tarantellae TaxID=39493 RepID=A0A6I1ML81_9CLOT|nr:DUF3343 domain-containing protein [Clostridium tarantellae]
MKDFIIVFNNTHEAMAGEKIFKENNIKFMIMPTPTYITKSCGISIRFKECELSKIDILISNKQITFKNIYVKDQSGFQVFK